MSKPGHLHYTFRDEEPAMDPATEWMLKTGEGFEYRKRLKAEVEAKARKREVTELKPTEGGNNATGQTS